MRSTELAEAALSMRNVTFDADDLWTTFEVIDNGELGMVKGYTTNNRQLTRYLSVSFLSVNTQSA